MLDSPGNNLSNKTSNQTTNKKTAHSERFFYCLIENTSQHDFYIINRSARQGDRLNIKIATLLSTRCTSAFIRRLLSAFIKRMY